MVPRFHVSIRFYAMQITVLYFMGRILLEINVWMDVYVQMDRVNLQIYFSYF